MVTKPFWEESSDDEAPEPPKKRRKRGLLDDSSSDDEKQTAAARGRSPSNAIDIDVDDDETGAARERCSSNAVELDDDEDDAAAPRALPAARARSFAESHRVYANALERSSRPASAADLAPRELFAGVTSALVTTFGTNAARQTKKFLRAHAPRDARVVVVVDGEALRGDVGARRRRRAPEADYGDGPRQPATEALRLKADDCDVALVHWPRRGDAPRLGGAYAATRGGLVGVAEKRGAALVRFVAARPDGAPGHEPSHAKLVARAGRGGRGFVYVGSANLSAPGWRRGGFQLGVVLTNVQLGSLPLPFAVLGADGEPRGAGAFEALSPDDAWLPRRERGGPGGRRGEAARERTVQVSRPRDQNDSAALDLGGWEMD
ncbi:hypothetical protein JL722_8206 [Aureococcus anophagefferens]|nr:hypothetical protein JL722_8206 [Aureococcus anophagefferens]